jgi:class 3 adenylate cyclase
VLIVDDNETNRDLLSRRLTRHGYTLATAETGRQALELIRGRCAPAPDSRLPTPGGSESSPTWSREPEAGSRPEGAFDLILLDIMMPEMNGYQVLQELKADPALSHIPVIMISALDEIDSIVRCIESGAEDYLTKPFNPVLLKARIDACLEKKRLRDREAEHLRQIEHEKSRYEALLHVILPHDIVQELTLTNQVKPRLHEEVAVLFCDIVGFTPYCEQRQPEEVLSHLQEMVEVYEQLVLRYEMEKIKTIGDSFMACAGLLTRLENPALNSVRCGLEMVAAARQLTAQWKVRVGIHVGPVMAGVVGHRQYLFDLWGDTVNTAARVESHGVDGVVNVSRPTWERVADRCQGESLGLIPLKGKGEVEIFRIDGLRDLCPVPG